MASFFQHYRKCYKMPDIKLAATAHPVLDIIRKRWSPRAFTNEIVSDEKLNSMFEAARWAASSNNEQPWEYYYAVKGTAGWHKLFNGLSEGNQKWVQHATILMACVSNKKFKKNGKDNSTAEHDLGLANSHIFLQAVAEGFYMHGMAGFDPVKIKETLALPHDKKVVCMMAGGYLGKPEILDEKNKASETEPRSRKTISEFVTRL